MKPFLSGFSRCEQEGPTFFSPRAMNTLTFHREKGIAPWIRGSCLRPAHQPDPSAALGCSSRASLAKGALGDGGGLSQLSWEPGKPKALEARFAGLRDGMFQFLPSGFGQSTETNPHTCHQAKASKARVWGEPQRANGQGAGFKNPGRMANGKASGKPPSQNIHFNKRDGFISKDIDDLYRNCPGARAWIPIDLAKHL